MKRFSFLPFLMLACATIFGPSIAAQESISPLSSNDCKGPVYQASEVSHRALITSHSLPQLTEEARTRGIGGTVVLTAVLCSSGRITDIKVVKGLPFGLTEQAVEAARQTKFTPAEKDAKQVSQAFGFEFGFRYIGERHPLARGPLEGRTIRYIEIGDCQAEFPDEVITRLKTQPGETYNKEYLVHDWQLLLQSGDFDEKASTLRIEEWEHGDLGIVFELKKRPKH